MVDVSLSAYVAKTMTAQRKIEGLDYKRGTKKCLLVSGMSRMKG